MLLQSQVWWYTFVIPATTGGGGRRIAVQGWFLGKAQDST
jgi:hypothetical protein